MQVAKYFIENINVEKMANSWFQFKKFKINQDKTAMKVGTDGVLLGAVSHFASAKRILDVGAGTGLLSFTAAQRTDAEIVALEIDKDAFIQCSENIELNNLNGRIKVINITFQEYYKTENTKFDFIISNPPFFENSQKSVSEKRNIARHSDTLSKEELISGVLKLLSTEGTFSIILPAEFEKSFDDLCRSRNLYCNYKMYVFPKKDKPANRIITEYSFVKKNIFTEKLIIRENDTNLYTNEYRELTKDFYLNF